MDKKYKFLKIYVFKKQEPVYTDEEICNLKFKM